MMAEDPKNHDFDQRHDGPQLRMSEDIARHFPRASTTPAFVADVEPRSASVSAPARKSMQLPPRVHEPSTLSGRKSAQISRPSRPSRDFDNRRDGPYGRPSLTMTRRKSSGYDPGHISAEDLASPRTASQQKPLSDGLDKDEQERDQITMDNSNSSIILPIETLVAYSVEPPPLNYNLWSRRYFICIFWSLIILDCVAMPITLYFALWYHTSLSHNAVFSIVTAALGGVSILEYIIRFWRLFKKGSTCRVIGARRMYLDWFHWNFTLGWIVIMVELIVGTVPDDPPIRLLAMPCASMLYAFGTELLVVDTLRYFQVPAPIRISSIPKGSQLRPGIYSVIEDVCAVDGSGGTAYREALNKRYEASHIFRAMLRRLGMFWAIGAEGMAVVLTILIFTINPVAAFVVGWSAPFVWAGIWALITVWYVKRKLKEEKKAWAEELAAQKAKV